MSALPLAPEAPLLLRVDGRDLVVLFCTPLDLEDLAVGHLVGRGLLRRREELLSIHVCEDRGRVDIGRADAPELPGSPVALLASGCGAGALPGELFGLGGPGGAETAPTTAPNSGADGPRFRLEDLVEGERAMFAAARLYRETGGLHCAALLREGEAEPLLVREDVGRHNAVDKVLGRAFLEGLDLSRCALLTSGRIAVDMVAKAAHAGLPLLGSRSIPTSSAYELARARGLALIGRLGSREPLVYCGGKLLLGL